MYYFIPSWYTGEIPWYSAASPWYRRNNIYEFDDTVNQIRMFRGAGEEVKLVVLSYSPGLRHFLHRQMIYPMPMWQLFDAIQGIDIEMPGILSYRDLDLGEDIEWFYTPHGIEGLRGGCRQVFIEFGPEGEMIQLDWFNLQSGECEFSRIFDDRGFHSSTIYYDKGTFGRQEFFDADETLQFTRYQDGRVVFTEDAHYKPERRFYARTEDLIGEVLQEFFAGEDFEESDEQKAVIVASNECHNSTVLQCLHGPEVIFSYFGDRFDFSHTGMLQKDLTKIDLAVADTERTASILRSNAPADLDVYDISPFDARLSLGRSQRTSELKVLMPLDGLEEPLFSTAMQQVFDYMEANPKVILYAVSESQEYADRERLYGNLRHCLESSGHSSLGIFLVGNREMENPGASPDGQRVIVTTFRSELELIQMLEDTRLIVDIRDQPNLYLQIAGISAGIPQVDYRFTRYVEHKKDGYIIANIHHVREGLEYYLSGLQHWNEALVYCIREIEKYTSGAQVEKWNELVKKNGKKN